MTDGVAFAAETLGEPGPYETRCSGDGDVHDLREMGLLGTILTQISIR